MNETRRTVAPTCYGVPCVCTGYGASAVHGSSLVLCPFCVWGAAESHGGRKQSPPSPKGVTPEAARTLSRGINLCSKGINLRLGASTPVLKTASSLKESASAWPQQMAPRRPGFSGPFPSQCVDAAHAGSRVTRLVAVRPRSLRDASPGSESSPPGRFSGRRPCVRSAIVKWQEATDPQSPKGGSQRACTHGGCPPYGFWASQRSGVVEAVGPALAVRKRSLWDASPEF